MHLLKNAFGWYQQLELMVQGILNPFPNDKSYKLKEFTDDNFEVEENGGRFFQMVENTVGKGEIARYEQLLVTSNFFFSHSVF